MHLQRGEPTAERIVQACRRLTQGRSLEVDLRSRSHAALDEHTPNRPLQNSIVAAKQDASTVRTVDCLNARDISITVVLFRFFGHAGERPSSRA